MVRREDTGPTEGRPTEQAVSRCSSPAGASPVRVSVGARGSRPPPEAERPKGEAWRRKPSAAQAVNGEQVRGPQHQVKPAASTDKQSGSRAAHVTAKAMASARESEWVDGPGGVWGAARGQGEVRNARGPPAQREQSRGCPYKPEAKSGAVQRESEGAVVLVMAPTNNVAGGKGPCFSHAEQVGTREGMTAESGSNHPGGHKVVVQFKAQEPRDARLREPAKLRGASCSKRTVGKPCAGNPHARFDRGSCLVPVAVKLLEGRTYQ